ncbi:hypothetical protein Syun_003302 [Stephania yunnanensis]|uniref:Uncharacterized protein n=1 Tax=Stephania yunnanensis TaxID=152371 RepID=A0AAP0Q0H7_9MAGN
MAIGLWSPKWLGLCMGWLWGGAMVRAVRVGWLRGVARVLMDQEKVKRKKLSSTSRSEDAFRGDASSLVQSRPMQDRKVADSFQVSSSSNGAISSPTIATQLPTFGKSPSSSANGLPSLDQKQEKVKVSASAFLEEARKTMDGIGVKKKVKKSNSGFISTDVRLEKPPSHQIIKEKPKQHKQNLNLPPQS